MKQLSSFVFFLFSFAWLLLVQDCLLYFTGNTLLRSSMQERLIVETLELGGISSDFVSSATQLCNLGSALKLPAHKGLYLQSRDNQGCFKLMSVSLRTWHKVLFTHEYYYRDVYQEQFPATTICSETDVLFAWHPSLHLSGVRSVWRPI